MGNPTLGIGILSWRAHQTLVQSLESYEANGFLDIFDEKLIYFSDVSDEDVEISERFGWRCAGGPNEGIAGGMKRLGENLKSKYIVLLQNDNPICEDFNLAKNHIYSGVDLLENSRCDIVRLRHQWNVGEGFADASKYLKYFPAYDVSDSFLPDDHGVNDNDYQDTLGKKIKRFLRPLKTKRLRGRSVFVEKNPHDVHPDVISKKGEFFIIDSSALNFTDQCLMMKRDLWLNTFCDYVDKNPDSGRSAGGFPAPECSINGPWWRNSHFKIAQGRGVFTHARYDGSFRPEHHTNQEE